MANLDPLLRLRKHSVDNKQKFLAGLYRQVEALQAEKDKLASSVERERKLLEEQDMLEALGWFGNFAAGVRSRVDKLDKEIEQLNQRIDIARADLREAFSDMKKVEITARRRAEEEQKEAQRKESLELDQIGVDGYRRGEDESK